MNSLSKAEAEALASFVESSLQCFAMNGGRLTGEKLVAALEPDTIPHAVTSAYLKLVAA
jgi:hypothetical protein